MSRRYPTRVGVRRVLVGLLVAGLAATGLVLLTTWLVPPAGRVETTPAPADPTSEDEADLGPGALDCPRSSKVDQMETPLTVTSSMLIDCPESFGSRIVTYTGEAIRTVFPLGDRAVVILNDDDYALEVGPLPESRTALGGNSGIAVVVPAATAERIEVLGDYSHRGALVRVVGRYEPASEALGGEPAILGRTATVVEAGYDVDHAISPRTVVAAVLAAIVALATAVLTHRQDRPPARGRLS